jgi:hypothetical protein
MRLIKYFLIFGFLNFFDERLCQKPQKSVNHRDSSHQTALYSIVAQNIAIELSN